jgi:hypothetical protein
VSRDRERRLTYSSSKGESITSSPNFQERGSRHADWLRHPGHMRGRSYLLGNDGNMYVHRPIVLMRPHALHGPSLRSDSDLS